MMSDGSPRAGAAELRLIGPEDSADLQAVFEGAGDYFLRVTGRPTPAADAAERELSSAASTVGREVALIVPANGRNADGKAPRALGALGWWSGHPEPEVALIGMLMILPEERGRGFARAALAALEGRLRESGIVRLRTAVGVDDHQSRAFIEAVGFASLDRRSRVDVDSGRLRIAFFEKAL